MNFIEFAKHHSEDFFYFVLRFFLRDCASVLDVGCGYNSALRYIKLPIWKEGIDIFRKNIDIGKKHKIHNRYTLGDVTKLHTYFKPKTFDATLCIDVIEHLTKKDGLLLLKRMEKIAKKRVIVLTPIGFYEQEAINQNPYQVHKSGWVPQDFTSAGYKVFGLRGLRILRDDHASIHRKPWIFWGSLSFLSEILFFFFPSLCFDLIAIKEL